MPVTSAAAARFLTAEWRHLVMLNYEVDPAILQPRLPGGTELESWLGRTFASLVGFRFLRTRVMGVAIPWHVDFEEVNLRFYVLRTTPGGEVRRGVAFVKEIVPRSAIAWTARALYGERYVAMPMRHRVERDPPEPGGPGLVEYGWRFRGRWNRLAATATGQPWLPPAGSEEALVTEHYWGYGARPRGGTFEYRVEHPQWRVWAAAAPQVDCDAAELYGADFAPFLSGAPFSAFVAEGSPVTVRRGVPIA